MRVSAQQARKRLDHGVAADAHRRVDGHRLRPLDGHAGKHQLMRLAVAQDAIGLGQFHARVDAQQLGRILDMQRADGVPVAREESPPYRSDNIRRVIGLGWTSPKCRHSRSARKQ